MYTTLKSQDSELPIFYLPAGEDSPILLVFPSIYGIDTDLEELAFQINALDVSVVVVDLFWQVGKGALGFNQTREALSRKGKISRLDGIHNALHCCELIRESRLPLLALGIGYGGHLAFCAAAEHKVDGICCWHPDGLGDYAMLSDEIQVPVQLHFGEEDVLVLPHEIAAIKEGLSENANASICVHKGAGFNFSHRSHPSYNESAYQQLVRDLESWLRRWI